MYLPIATILLFGTMVCRAVAQDDDDDDDGNDFGAVDEGIAQIDTSQLCDMILNQCPGGFPASSCRSSCLPLPT